MLIMLSSSSAASLVNSLCFCIRRQAFVASSLCIHARTVHHYPHHVREALEKKREEAAIVKEELPPLDIYGCLRDIKYSPRKLNMIAAQVRRLKIQDAIVQMEFSEKKGAKFIKQVLENTQEKAVKSHFVSDPNNLYVELSYVGKGQYIRKIKIHGRGRHGIMHDVYSHYFLMLREGDPPVKKKKEDNPIYITRKLIMKGPRSIPNAL